MTFFYDLNKRLSQLADKQDAKQLAEDVKASAPKSKLAESMDVAETGYSAKAARAGKDIGKPGKNFAKIAKSAGAKYGSKAAGERVAGAVLNKLRHPKEDIEQEGNAFTGALAKTPKGSKFKLGNKEFKDTSSIEEGHCPACDCSPCKCNEGNEFTGNLAKAKAAHKSEFEVDGKKYKVVEADPTGLGEEEMAEGFADMDAWLASREKEKGTGKFDKRERTLPSGMKATTYTRRHEDEPEDDSDAPVAKGGSPKKRGRPMGKPKGPERVTAKSYKYKAGRPTKANEGDVAVTDRGEYDDEAGMAKDSLHTIVRSAKELEHALRSNENLPEWVQEKIGQIKGMMSSVTDYILSTHERGTEQATGHEGITLEKAPPGAKAERMVKGIKKSLSKDGNLSGKDKAIAYATTWKAKKAGKVEEEGLEKHSTSALKAAAGKDLKADKKSGVPSNVKTSAVKDELKKRDQDKEEKVDETTVAGSVATAPAAPKAGKGMQFGKGVYENFNSKVENMITEGMSINISVDEQGKKSISVNATEGDAEALAQLLKMAGLGGGHKEEETCSDCGASPCGCEAEVVDENSPDWPTNTETIAANPELRTYSGGLNGPKSTGQTTTPVIAGQLRRQASMEENIDLERSLFKTWKNYKG